MFKPEIKIQIKKPAWDGLFLNYSYMGEELEFDISSILTIDKQNLVFNLYILVEDYLNSLPSDVINIYWGTLKEASHFKEFGKNETRLKIINSLNDVINILDYNNLKQWMRFNVNRIFIPEGMVDNFEYDPDLNTTREKTYTKWDYVDLVSLTLMFRLTLPLYANYYRAQQHINSTLCNYITYCLFDVTILPETPEVVKLTQYIAEIEKNIESRSIADSYILNKGLSSDDMTANTLAVVMFSKLLPNDFINKTNNPVSFVFNAVRFRASFNPTDETYRDKRLLGDEDGKSTFDEFRQTPSVSQGVIAEMQLALDGVLDFYWPDFTEHEKLKYESEIGTTTYILQQQPQHHVQIVLLGILLNKYAPYQVLSYLEERKILELLTLAKIIMWRNGHTFLSVLMTSYSTTRTDLPVVLSAKTSVSKSAIEPILSRYSFVAADGRVPVIEETISEMAKSIVSTTWIPTASTEELNAIKSPSNYLAIPPNLVELIIKFVADNIDC